MSQYALGVTLIAVAAALPVSGLTAQQAAAPTPVAAPAPAASTWRIDRTHSELSFRIRHLVSRVQGSFGDWSGTIVADAGDWSRGAVEVVIQAASIDTRNERRDNHLRSDEFFDVATHPTITFRSRSVAVDGEAIRVTGDLTMRGVTRPVVLEGRLLGRTPDSRGGERAGFEARTTIDRTDFGVSWNRAAEAGGALLGDEVQIEITLAAVRAAR